MNMMVLPRDINSGEPLTPAGRVFLQKETPQVVHFAIGMKHDIDVQAVKEAIKHSLMPNHPRFSSLMVRNRWGVEQWTKTDDIDIDRHFIVIDAPVIDGEDDDAAVNEYLADLSLSSSTLDEAKPLWEIHLLKAHKCMVMRIHHALGDGISLVSMIQALCTDPDSIPTTITTSSNRRRSSLWLLVQRVWLSVVFIVGFTLRSLWVKDRKNPISGGDGVELWPRKLATARFKLNDMVLVKKSVQYGATINDVLIGVISAGLHQYLDAKWPGSMQSGMQITGIAAVNLRKQPGLHDIAKLMSGDPSIRWGNLFGIMLFPLYYSATVNPLDHITNVKEMLDRKKSSFEAAFSYWTTCLVTSWFGSKVASNLLRRIFCNTTFTVSNLVGPQEGIAYLGNPITYIRVNVSSLPHSLTMHMVSYAGRADLQIMVAKDIIPDPDFLAECFEGALMDMKLAALSKTT